MDTQLTADQITAQLGQLKVHDTARIAGVDIRRLSATRFQVDGKGRRATEVVTLIQSRQSR